MKTRSEQSSEERAWNRAMPLFKAPSVVRGLLELSFQVLEVPMALKGCIEGISSIVWKINSKCGGSTVRWSRCQGPSQTAGGRIPVVRAMQYFCQEVGPIGKGCLNGWGCWRICLSKNPLSMCQCCKTINYKAQWYSNWKRAWRGFLSVHYKPYNPS